MQHIPFGLQGITITHPYTHWQHKKIHHAPLFGATTLWRCFCLPAAAAFLLLLSCFLFWPNERASLCSLPVSLTHRHGNKRSGDGSGCASGSGSNGKRRLSSFFSTRAQVACCLAQKFVPHPAFRISVPLGRLSTVKSICQKSLTAAYSQNTHTPPLSHSHTHMPARTWVAIGIVVRLLKSCHATSNKDQRRVTEPQF